jgi:hypothetical protein
MEGTFCSTPKDYEFWSRPREDQAFSMINTIHSAVIVFNLALVFHLASLQPGSPRQHELLGRAQNRYQHSYLLITGSMNVGNTFVNLLAMAVWNNQAHIQLECYFDHESSGLLLWQLCSMALEVKRTMEREKRVFLCVNNTTNGSSSNHRQETAVLIDQHVDLFLSNAFFSGLRGHTSAPAA